ncbi:OmpA family protein [Blastomonas aquatica]|uniref:OmpA-like domain-containing protein n=1 Tax=Blastomonas aquatica TaxID=1510276 RepID=A0ABQ1IYI9_9SPHN|nr:OmpA family protein [Blastomonas aquatica]GGB55112.1 hypothetical protein GCM10010833_07250 [Blastomonas aquatica]
MTERSFVSVAAALLAGSVMVSACDGGILGGGDGTPVDIQEAHPSGVVLNVRTIRIDGERTAVDLTVINGRDREIRLNQGRENSYVLGDGGEKLLLVPPSGNTTLAVPGTRATDMTLVFEGAASGSGNITLVLNENGSLESYSNNPRFQISLPVSGSGGSAPEISAMSNLRPIPMTRLGPASTTGSTLGSTTQGSSDLRAVEALKSELGAVETDRGTLVSLPGDVTFDFDKASIKADARATLGQLAELISANGGGVIMIEGHTDSRGDDAYNQRLSLARAEAVKTYLAEKGVPADRMRTLGLGETRPVAANAGADGSDDEAGRQRNRRVEVILPQGGTAAGSG